MADIYTIYPTAKKLLLDGSIDLLNDTIKIALLNGYTYDPVHDYWNDVSAQEITPTGTYAAGGTELASKAVDLDAGDEEGYFDAADLVVGTAMTATLQQVVMYKSTGTAATSPLIGCLSLENPVVLAAQNYVLTFSSDGIMRLL